MKPRLFPSHVNLILDEDERLALHDLYDLDALLRTTPLRWRGRRS